MPRDVLASQPDLARLGFKSGGEAGPVGSLRFTRLQRLLKPSEFKLVFTESCRVSSSHITMLAVKNHLCQPRLGLAISKRNVKLATNRNLIKREIRESFRLHQAIIGGFDVVVMAKAGSELLSRSELRQQIDGCWQKMSKRCEPF